MRYLGMSLGMGVALGYCAALGTLFPPLLKAFLPSVPVPETIVQIASTTAGQISLGGVAVCLLGIAIAALAGWTKEKEMPEAEKKKVIAEFSFTKGILVATFSGIMSACFNFALTAGAPMSEASKAAGTALLWSGLPRLVIVLLGGFTTNFMWCVFLNFKNKTGYQYFQSRLRAQLPNRENETIIETAIDAPGEEVAAQTMRAPSADGDRVPILRNYFFSALAGATWYMQFFFYTMGETQMGKLNYVSWSLHMASIIIFSTMWGWIFHEWKGSSRKAHTLIAGGIATLILSTLVTGLGAWLKARGAVSP
jgi:L-rhamnose-H+ transport protein